MGLMVDGWAMLGQSFGDVDGWELLDVVGFRLAYLINVARMFQGGFFSPKSISPFRLTMVTSVRALKRHLIGLIWYIKGWVLIELFLFLFEITKKILLNDFFWEIFVLRMRSSHFFLEKGLGDGYMRTPILTRFTQHHLRSWGCDPLYQQFWQMKKGQNAWHWALPLHIVHWGKSTPQMLNQWRFRSRQAGCYVGGGILSYTWPELAMISDVIQSFWMTKKYPINEAGETNESCPAFCCALNSSTTPIWPPVNGSIVVGGQNENCKA